MILEEAKQDYDTIKYLEAKIADLEKQLAWINYDPNSDEPTAGKTIIALIESFKSKKQAYTCLVPVKEDDVSFRILDDKEDEFNEWAWQIIKWRYVI